MFSDKENMKNSVLKNRNRRKQIKKSKRENKEKLQISPSLMSLRENKLVLKLEH